MRQSQEGRALRQFTLSTGKSAGRNSSGRITVFHRGGGSKRLQRRIDLKRSTSSIGIVERIEYDPNRSSRIAPVRWIEGVQLQLRRQRKCNTIEEFAPPRKILEPTTTTIRGLFSFSFLPRKVDQRKVACFFLGVEVKAREDSSSDHWMLLLLPPGRIFLTSLPYPRVILHQKACFLDLSNWSRKLFWCSMNLWYFPLYDCISGWAQYS